MGPRLRIMSGRGRCKVGGRQAFRRVSAPENAPSAQLPFVPSMWSSSIADIELLSSMLPDDRAFMRAYAQRGMVGVPAGLEQLKAFSKDTSRCGQE